MSEATTQAAGNTPATGSAQPDAGASTAVSGAAPAAAPASSAPAPAASSQQATTGQPAGAPAASPSSQAPAAAPKAAAGAPERYEFKAPTGVALDEGVVAKFSTVAKEMGLSQEAAQKVIDALGPEIVQSNTKTVSAAMTQAATAWAQQTQADTEIGGDKLDENLGVAKKALERFATPELRALLNRFNAKDNPKGTGLGNHPEVVRLFVRMGKAISEDKFVTGSTQPATGKREPAEVLYGNKPKA